MRFKVSTIVAAAALIAAPSATVSGQSFVGNGCTGNTFLFCASWTGTIIGGNTLQLAVTNTSNAAPANNTNSTFTQIFIGAIPGPISVSLSESGDGNWIGDNPPSGLEGFGLTTLLFGVRSNPGINAGIIPGQTAIINFAFSGPVSDATFANVQIAIHDQGVPSGSDCVSSKGVMAGHGGANITTQPTGTCGGGGFNIAPEPSTYALMAAGLAALGFVARRRQQTA